MATLKRWQRLGLCSWVEVLLIGWSVFGVTDCFWPVRVVWLGATVIDDGRSFGQPLGWSALRLLFLFLFLWNFYLIYLSIFIVVFFLFFSLDSIFALCFHLFLDIECVALPVRQILWWYFVAMERVMIEDNDEKVLLVKRDYRERAVACRKGL